MAGALVGATLGPTTLELTRADLVRYAGASGDFNPIHWSEAAAREADLPDVIAHGMLTMGRAIQVVVDWAGDPGAIVDYEVRFSRPVPVPALGATVLLVEGKVTAVQQRVAEVALTVWHGDTKVLGRAQVRVDLSRVHTQSAHPTKSSFYRDPE
ncbi:MAG: MaoC family dehydratase [Bifidobacteriaceae bacterium]|nr:MaoC family dehydratase [Bifidobacteriaceae bacterium]